MRAPPSGGYDVLCGWPLRVGDCSRRFSSSITAMRLPISRLRLRLAAAALVVGVFAACDNSPFEPRGEGERVPIGVVIEGEARTDSLRWYSFGGSPNQPFVVFLEALQGGVYLAVYDSTHGFRTADLVAFAGGPALDQNPSNTFGTPAGTVYRVSVQATAPGPTARFRFKVYAINTTAEKVPDVFSFGDTVNGESIDPMVDLDWFHADGVAGQEIVTVVEAQGPAGSGSVGLNVIDQSTNQFLGYVFADAGTANRLTTGRMRLTGTHDYLFAFGSVTSNTYPRYRGPYRFWTYVINRAPEHRAAAIPFNTEIADERIDREGDVDEFTFQANAGDAFNAFVQAPRAFQVEVALVGGAAFAAGTAVPADTALFAHPTGRFSVAQTGTYVVRILGSGSHQVADTGQYRFYLYAINHSPEHVAAAIVPGDTVSGEAIELPGDIDEFTFSGTVGEELNAFLHAQPGSPETVRLEVVDPGGTVLRIAQSVATDTSLLRQPTGRFALTNTGTYRLRVKGASDFLDHSRGPYRLFLYRVNRAPESVPATLAFGDSVSGEAIDVPGDVDEFRVTVPDSSGANLVVELVNPANGGLMLQLIDSASRQVIVMGGAPATGRGALGRMRLAPGKYIVRADGNPYEDHSVMQGGYRIWFYRFGFDPEVAADTFAIGDTVSGESIEPWGDDDQFHFYGLRGQHINLMAQGLSAPSSGAFQFFLMPPPGVPGYGAFLNSGTAAGALADHQTTRIDLLGTGWYTVDVSGVTGQFSERGPYRFVVQVIDPGPEHVSATLTAGDSVVSEPIDAPGDWDEFTLLGTPGQTMSVMFDGSDFTGLYLQVFDPATDDTLAWQPHQFRRIAGPFRIPASGQVKISVAQPAGFFRICYSSSCGLFSFAGPYRFHVLAVNRLPENVAPTFVVGDTVRGERLSPVGDVDEFTSTGTGEQLTLWDRLTATSSLDSALVLEVIDPATGTSLVGGNAAILGSSEFYSLGAFTVPASGTFIVRAHVYGEWGYAVGETTTYEFFVKRGP